MKAFQDFLRNNLSTYADMCKIINVSTDENGFNWISECSIRDNDNVYRIYSLPSRHTKSIKSNVKVPRLLTQDYGYYIENNCITMYLRKGYKPIDTILKTLSQCHSYASFIHTFSVNIGGNTLAYLEDKCIKEGLYFTVKRSNDNGTEVYKLKGIFTNKIIGIILVSEWSLPAEDISVDVRDTYNSTDIGAGETISESIVRICHDKSRQCICVDAYIGYDENYSISKQHANNVNNIKSEAEHKGLDILIQASRASEI